jgi:hypothetical protein
MLERIPPIRQSLHEPNATSSCLPVASRQRWRRGRDLNPRRCYPHTISNRAHSAGLCYLSMNQNSPAEQLYHRCIAAPNPVPMDSECRLRVSVEPAPLTRVAVLVTRNRFGGDMNKQGLSGTLVLIPGAVC